MHIFVTAVFSLFLSYSLVIQEAAVLVGLFLLTSREVFPSLLSAPSCYFTSVGNSAALTHTYPQPPTLILFSLIAT